MVGFCFGGYMVNYLVVVDSKLIDVGVFYYGILVVKEFR